MLRAFITIKVEIGARDVRKIVEITLSPAQLAEAMKCRQSAAATIARQIAGLVEVSQPLGHLDPPS